MADEVCKRCKDRPVTRILTIGRGARVRVRRYCDECADDCLTIFGSAIRGDCPA